MSNVNSYSANFAAFSGLNNSQNDNKEDSWFEAMADAWGQALDRQATRIEDMSTNLGEQGVDTPSAITELTAESLKMSFLSNSSHTAISSVGSALDVMARKQ